MTGPISKQSSIVLLKDRTALVVCLVLRKDPLGVLDEALDNLCVLEQVDLQPVVTLRVEN